MINMKINKQKRHIPQTIRAANFGNIYIFLYMYGQVNE